MKHLFAPTVALLALFSVPVASAHEFWIQPSNATPQVGELTRLSIYIGEPFGGLPVVRDQSHFQQFEMIDPNGATTAILGLDGRAPAGLFRAELPGLHVVSYHSHQSLIEHSPEGFEHYIEEDGLEHIAGDMPELEDVFATITEVYSRCAKALILAGDGASIGFDRVIGLELELVPTTDPFRSSAESNSFQLLYQGEACQGALVVAVNRNQPGVRHTARSDDHGGVEFDLEADGTWLVSAVHMVAGDEDTGADWESSWASLTFTRPAMTGAEQMPAPGHED